MKILVIKTITNSLKPAFNTDMEVFNKMPKNEIFEISYVKKRNVRFHRKYFALLNLCFENQEIYDNLEEMRHDVIVTAGFYDDIVNKLTGEIFKKAKSISFDSMDEIKFIELYDKTKNVIIKWIGVKNEDIEEQIEQYF